MQYYVGAVPAEIRAWRQLFHLFAEDMDSNALFARNERRAGEMFLLAMQWREVLVHVHDVALKTKLKPC